MKPLLSNSIDQFIYLQACPSTNDYAINNLSNNDPKPNSCVYTFNQTAGRGQIGRYWFSGAYKNLTSSTRLQLRNFPVRDQFLLNITFALSVREFVALHTTQEVKIKWPNDIYVANKKIAGILIQNNLRGNEITSTILGVGLNVFEDNFPTDLPNPISLVQLDQQMGSLPTVKILPLIQNQSDDDQSAEDKIKEENLPRLLSLQLQLADLIISRFSEIKAASNHYREEYLSSLYLLDTESKFIIADSEVKGIIRGVTESGKLEVEINGQRQLFAFRELQYVLSQ